MSIEESDRPHVERIKAQISIGANTLSENEVTLFWDQGRITYVREGNRAVTAVRGAILPGMTSLHKQAFAEKAVEAMNQERKVSDALCSGDILDLEA